MLHFISGIYTGSVYNDTGLRNAGFLGESIRNGSVLVIKTHHPPNNTLYNRAIVLMRNPLDAIVANFNRIKTGGNHTGVVNSTMFTSDGKYLCMYLYK